MRTQEDKGADFRALHEQDGAFIIPNPWDVGTARLLARLVLTMWAIHFNRFSHFSESRSGSSPT